MESPGKLYSTLMDIIVRFARAGLIHGDFNEFNILIQRETGIPVVIDFPQMVSTSHVNAEWSVLFLTLRSHAEAKHKSGILTETWSAFGRFSVDVSVTRALSFLVSSQ